MPSRHTPGMSRARLGFHGDFSGYPTVGVDGSEEGVGKEHNDQTSPQEAGDDGNLESWGSGKWADVRLAGERTAY